MKAIIIDDELHCITTLKTMLSKYTDVKIAAHYSDPLEAAKTMNDVEADILFIDIEMPHLNGFELLNLFPGNSWNVVFTTAYDDYAIKAFKVSAIDYLLKPISKTDLIDAIEKCRKNHKNNHKIKESFRGPFNERVQKIAIPSLAGLELIVANDILYLESDSNYTIVHLSDKNQIMVSKTLKSFEDLLYPFGFIRVHHSFMVNSNRITRYVRGDGGYLIMENGMHINVSRSRKEDLLSMIQPSL
jgi:two-component system LytT family response regulator